MKDLRRYLVLKYIQYLVLSSPNAASTVLGLLGSAYSLLLLQSAKVSSKSTTVLISGIAQADILVSLCVVSDVILWVFDVDIASPAFASALLQNLLTANAHVSCLLLSCIALEAYLITFYPVQSRHLRTVRNARRTARIIWILVIAECVVFLMEEFLKANSISTLISSHCTWLLHFSGTTADVLRSFSYFLGIFLRILNVYFYYKIFFSMSNR
ncbi:GALR3 protein, partial [Crypturellus undulatus]|nr:GALR3 protein [Crypturellus undulatus]